MRVPFSWHHAKPWNKGPTYKFAVTSLDVSCMAQHSVIIYSKYLMQNHEIPPANTWQWHWWGNSDEAPSIVYPNSKRYLMDAQHVTLNIRYTIRYIKNLNQSKGGWWSIYDPRNRSPFGFYWVLCEIEIKLIYSYQKDRIISKDIGKGFRNPLSGCSRELHLLNQSLEESISVS